MDTEPAAVGKWYDTAFRAKMAGEPIKNQRILVEIASKYKDNSNRITKWNRKMMEELPTIFSGIREKAAPECQELIVNILVS